MPYEDLPKPGARIAATCRGVPPITFRLPGIARTREAAVGRHRANAALPQLDELRLL